MPCSYLHCQEDQLTPSISLPRVFQTPSFSLSTLPWCQISKSVSVSVSLKHLSVLANLHNYTWVHIEIMAFHLQNKFCRIRYQGCTMTLEMIRQFQLTQNWCILSGVFHSGPSSRWSDRGLKSEAPVSKYSIFTVFKCPYHSQLY